MVQLSTPDLNPPWAGTSFHCETDTVLPESEATRPISWPRKKKNPQSHSETEASLLPCLFFLPSNSLWPGWVCVMFESYVTWLCTALPYCNTNLNALFRNVKFWISSWSSAVSRTLAKLKPHACKHLTLSTQWLISETWSMWFFFFLFMHS